MLKKFEVIAYISNWAFFGCSQSPSQCFLNMSNYNNNNDDDDDDDDDDNNNNNNNNNNSNDVIMRLIKTLKVSFLLPGLSRKQMSLPKRKRKVFSISYLKFQT